MNLIKSLILEFRLFIHSHSIVFTHAVIIKNYPFYVWQISIGRIRRRKFSTCIEKSSPFPRHMSLMSYLIFVVMKPLPLLFFFIIIIMIVVISLATSAVRPNRAQPMENRCPNDAQPSDPTSEKLHAIVIKSVLRMSFIVVFFTTRFFMLLSPGTVKRLWTSAGPELLTICCHKYSWGETRFHETTTRDAIYVCYCHQRPPIIHWHSRAATGDNVQLVSRVCWHLFAHFTN